MKAGDAGIQFPLLAFSNGYMCIINMNECDQIVIV